MKISFIVPCYNTPARLLHECIDSILQLGLSSEEYELIVIDDGSDEMVEEYLDGYGNDVKCYRIAHQGLSMARNVGFMVSCGDYIQYVDSDDCLLPDAYGEVIRHLREEHPDMLQFRFVKDKSPQGVRGKVCADWHVTMSGREFLQHNNVRPAAWSYVFLRKIKGDLKFMPGLIHEDELFTPLLMMRAHSIMTTKTQAYFYRQTEGSITENKTEEHVMKRLNDMHFIISELKNVEGLERRAEQLTINLLYMTFKLTRSLVAVIAEMQILRYKGWLPLPFRHYTWKHTAASLLSRMIYPRKIKQTSESQDV